jgi:hypothetical protein
MYDSIDPSQFAGLSMDAAAGYVDGKWQTFPTLGQHVPPGTYLLSITVFGSVNAECVDQEPGNIGPDAAADWLAAKVDSGVWRPVLYTSASNVQNMLNLCSARGMTRGQLRVWSAHYGAGEHLCGVMTCGFPDADATQWTDRAHGRNLDQSVCLDSFIPDSPPVAGEEDHTMVLDLVAGGPAAVAVAPAGVGRVALYVDYYGGTPGNLRVVVPGQGVQTVTPAWGSPAVFTAKPGDAVSVARLSGVGLVTVVFT